MVKYGETEYSIEFITNKGERSWYHMIRDIESRLTTEVLDGDIELNIKWSHKRATTPVNVITRYMIVSRPKVLRGEKRFFELKVEGLDDFEAMIPINNRTVSIYYCQNNTVTI